MTIRVFTALLLALLAGPVQAEVFEVGSDGTFRAITRPAWKPAPVQVVSGQVVSATTGPQGHRHDALIAQASARHGVSSALIDAIAFTESRYRSDARSPKGAVGVMQLMPGTALELGVKNPLDPAQNIDGGTAYLRAQLDRFDNDLIRAVAAYNAGPEAVRRYNGIPPFAETRDYVRRVLDRLATAALTGVTP